MHVIKNTASMLAASMLMFGVAKADVSLVSGWNLVGNGSTSEINVASVFGDASKYTTVWKWNSSAGTWSFYTPSLSATDLAAYAQTKGYGVLSTINSKEGFWVNAKGAATASNSSNSAGAALLQSDVSVGWNLLASADGKTPTQLNASLSSSLSSNGKSITTVWAWDANTSSWRFYAPSLEAQGGTVLADYIANKKYLSFVAPLGSTDGFWMNVGSVTSTQAISDPNNAMPVVAVVVVGM